MSQKSVHDARRERQRARKPNGHERGTLKHQPTRDIPDPTGYFQEYYGHGFPTKERLQYWY